MLFQLAVLVRAGTAQLIGMMRASPFAKPGFEPHILSRRGGCSSTIFQVRHLADAACNVEVGVFTRGHTCKLLGIIETEDVHGRPSGDLGLQELSGLLWGLRGGVGILMLMFDQ